jgi:predicted metal-binding membrane protein
MSSVAGALTSVRALRRDQLALLAAFLVLAAGCWLIVVQQSSDMPGMGLTMGAGAGLFLAIWLAMMAAMMLPAASPMILIYARISAEKRRRNQAYVPAWVFAASYLALWAVVGVVAYLLAVTIQSLADRSEGLMSAGPRIGGAIFVLAGIYQLTPLKDVCLASCRSPLAFVLTSWRDGYVGAVRMGLRHGLLCLGCCWMLFAILFPLGLMNLAAMAAITIVITAEKLLQRARPITWVVAVALVLYGLLVIVHPDALPGMAMHTQMKTMNM